MTRKFDPDTNPYADDLLRLSLAPPGRYSDVERSALARIIASKLYKVALVEPHYIDFGFSSWKSEIHGGEFVEIVVLFDSDMRKPIRQFPFELSNSTHESLVVLTAGSKGVVELFNGVPDRSTFEKVRHAFKQLHANDNGDTSSELGVTLRRSDDEAASNYLGNGGDGDRGNGNGNGGGGSGGGGGATNGVPGRGGVGELINHPVLFTVERHTFDAILEQV